MRNPEIYFEFSRTDVTERPLLDGIACATPDLVGDAPSPRLPRLNVTRGPLILAPTMRPHHSGGHPRVSGTGSRRKLRISRAKCEVGVTEIAGWGRGCGTVLMCTSRNHKKSRVCSFQTGYQEVYGLPRFYGRFETPKCSPCSWTLVPVTKFTKIDN